MALIIEPEPVAVRQSIPAHRQLETGLVTGTNCPRGLAPALDVSVRRANSSRRAPRPDVHLVEARGVKLRLSLLHPGPTPGMRAT
jgi:hypothetical protein